MSYNIKDFQSRYQLNNKEIATVCGCSLPTIQKWRSGEVAISGAAVQLMKLLDSIAGGDAIAFKKALKQMKLSTPPAGHVPEPDHLFAPTLPEERIDVMLESRRRERQLAESEARYSAAVDADINPICRWLPDTTLTYVNDAYRRLFAGEGKELVGSKWIDMLPPERHRAVEAVVSDMVRRGETEVSVHEETTADGRIIHLEWRDMPVKNDRGEVVELHSVGYDVTELVRLRRLEEESRQTRNAFLDLIKDPVVLFDEHGRFLEMNKPCEELMAQNEKWTGIDDLLKPAIAIKFKRLLKRVSSGKTFCFQMQVNQAAYRLVGRYLPSAGKMGRYLAVLEENGAAVGSPVTQVRLQNEIVVEGQRKTLNIDPLLVERVEKSMGLVGAQARVDRVYVFSLDDKEGVFDNLLEWCAEGVQPHIDELQGFPMSEYAWWVGRIRKNQWIQFDDTSQMPRGAFREREVLVAQDIRSIMVAPVLVGGKPVGFVGFDHNHTTRIWHEQEQNLLESFRKEVEELFTQMRAN